MWLGVWANGIQGSNLFLLLQSLLLLLFDAANTNSLFFSRLLLSKALIQHPIIMVLVESIRRDERGALL